MRNNTKLSGQIGEHLVSAALGLQGYYAAPFSGNVPGFDLVATNAETHKSLPVQVKTSRGGSAVSITSIDKWADVSIDDQGRQNVERLKKLDHPDLIWIICAIENGDFRAARFYITTASQIQEKVIASYRSMLEKHNGRRPRNPHSKHCAIWPSDVAEFEDNWEVIIDRAG